MEGAGLLVIPFLLKNRVRERKVIHLRDDAQPKKIYTETTEQWKTTDD